MKFKRILVFLLQIFESLQSKRFEIRKLYMEHLRPMGRMFYIFFGFLSVAILILDFGFYYPVEWKPYVTISIRTLVSFFIGYETLHLIFTNKKWKEYLDLHKIELIILLMLGLEVIYEKNIISVLKSYHISGDDTTLIFLSANQFLFLFSNLAHFFRLSKKRESKKLNPSIVFVGSFAFIILMGVCFLHFPKSTNGDVRTIDILFTTISATCVTGLSTLDISSQFTLTGQLVILLLIQVGGLGLMTLTSFFSIFLTGKGSVSDTLMLKDLLSEETMGRAKDTLKQITLQTLAIEFVGATLLFCSFPKNFPVSFPEKIYYSVFHSISAFCNAGFSLMPNGMATEAFRDSEGFLTILMFLIVFGSLGFPVLYQIRTRLFHPRDQIFRWSLTSKLVFRMSALLLIFGWTSHLLLEWDMSLKEFSMEEKLFHSLFYSVTTRSGGLHTFDLGLMGHPMTFVTFFLMWVGGSPVSTGGGIKTTTFAISILNITNQIRGKSRMEIDYRTIADSTISRAGATIVLSLFVIFIAIFCLLLTENAHFIDLCFEAVSAFSTTGLSRGLTPHLSDSGKIIICVVMFVGRVGILTLLIALSKKVDHIAYEYPKEYVVVG
ncbi:Potassium transport system, membrane component [Leptospira biflexa serovar Patoc strain 'Patoc 1 (Ames)']|uniref:Cation transporter n=1 Tax=Leptospira biflexa serovar Patoc (strain Patoc 1 / ATCC 23582 / Paris) TaxID=456481 RepID=B0SJZ1_LEPBP|nr:potassium transporter TrkG [Leptospira biflexa]ABZ92695.1 Potassium transport system, membrane component [Leptospira biflexa serovar Patoc strain 'Patoc 1 (Ames)']ABZ96297.1 Cation transporter [Leptospira biflexa serovar Patoc strain 'Patoc 1 (Paris)']